jgi:hypothetical protein
MALSAQSFLHTELSNIDIPTGVSFAHPEDAPSPQEEDALRQFLQAFEAETPASGLPLLLVPEDDEE